MQAQAAPAIWDFLLFWFFTGSSLLGLPPGERDPLLVKAVPPQTMGYFEWASRGPGQPGAAGIDGFAADPEIRQFFELLDAALVKREILDEDESDQILRSELPQFAKLIIKHPGCLFLGFEPKPLEKNALEGWINRLTGLHGGVILSLGEDADAGWASLIRILGTIRGFELQPSSLTQKIPFPIPIPGYQLFAHREGQRIIFSLGESTLPRTIDGLSGKIPGLESNPRFRDSLNRIATPRVSTVGWVDAQEITKTVTSVLGPLGGLVRPMLTMIGADSLDRVILSTGVDNGTMILRKFVATGGRTDGVMALFSGSPIQPAQLSHIPADADMVLAASISLNKLFQEARGLLAKTNPFSVRIFDEAVKQLETELGLKIAGDILPAFGDVITVFDSPAAGGMIASSLVASIEIRDRQKASLVFDRLLKLAEQSLVSEAGDSEPESPTIRRQEFLGYTIHFLNRQGQGYGVQLTASPTFCLADRHVLFAVHPQAMKACLRFMESQKQVASHVSPQSFDQVANRKISIPEGDVLSLFYLNGPRANGLLSTALPFLSPTLLLRLELEGIMMDSFAVPSAAAITPYFGDSTAVLSRQKDGLFFEAQNAPPVIASIALLSLVRNWDTSHFEMLEEARRRGSKSSEHGQLGSTDDKVVPAVAQSKPANADAEKAKSSPYLKLAPILLKSLLPEDVQITIPESVMKKIEEGPSPAAIQRREEAKQRREEMRRRREERRKPQPTGQQ